jgi:uncharacterized protein YjbI with pentapeptide repeats
MRQKRMMTPRPTARRRLVTGVVLAVVIFLAALVAIPEWTVGTVGLTVAERVAAVGATRQLIALLGGGTLAVVGVFYTHQRHIIDRRTNELQQDSNYTDRYTSAVTQLGADSHTIRLGGIYALERVARDSPGDREAVHDLLAAFVRSDIKRAQTVMESIAIDADAYRAPIDVAAAISVIARRAEGRAAGRPRINLQGATIGAQSFENRALLSDVLMSGIELTESSLRGAVLDFAHIDNAFLSHSDLSRSSLVGTNFLDTNLTGAYLDSANLRHADLRAADLTRANLTRANLTDATLTKADLEGTIFRLSTLDGTDFRGAVNWSVEEFESALSWSVQTKWPESHIPSEPNRSP